MLSCKSSVQLLKKDNVELISVEHIAADNKRQIDQIFSPKKVDNIINELNDCYQEPLVFKAQYILTILYKSGDRKLVICNGNSIKVDGLTYKINEPVSDIIN